MNGLPRELQNELNELGISTKSRGYKLSQGLFHKLYVAGLCTKEFGLAVSGEGFIRGNSEWVLEEATSLLENQEIRRYWLWDIEEIEHCAGDLVAYTQKIEPDKEPHDDIIDLSCAIVQMPSLERRQSCMQVESLNQLLEKEPEIKLYLPPDMDDISYIWKNLPVDTYEEALRTQKDGSIILFYGHDSPIKLSRDLGLPSVYLVKDKELAEKKRSQYRRTSGIRGNVRAYRVMAGNGRIGIAVRTYHRSQTFIEVAYELLDGKTFLHLWTP